MKTTELCVWQGKKHFRLHDILNVRNMPYKENFQMIDQVKSILVGLNPWIEKGE